MSNHLEKDRIRFICYTYIQTPNGSEIQIKAKKKKATNYEYWKKIQMISSLIITKNSDA